MTWERYYPSSSQVSDEPRLSIHASGDGRLNAAADREWFLDVDEVALHLDRDRSLLAIEPLADSESAAGPTLTLQREANKHGCDINTRGAMVDLGVDIEARDTATRLPLDWHDDRGFVVSDVSPVLDDAGPEDQDDVGDLEAEETEPKWGNIISDNPPDWLVKMRTSDALDTREKLDRLLGQLTAAGPVEQSASEIGAPIGLSGPEVAHNIRHLGDHFTVEKRDPPDAASASRWYVARNDDVSEPGDEPEGETSADTGADTEADAEADGGAVAVSADDTDRVRDVADEVDTLQALADRLDVDVERARGLAMSASVYSDLQDNPPRPGVDRDA